MSEEQAEYDVNGAPVFRLRSPDEQRLYWLGKADFWLDKHRQGDLKFHEILDIIAAVRLLAKKLPMETTP